MTQVTWQVPLDTPWWRLFRRSWEKMMIRTLRESLGDGPFNVVKTRGEFVWIEAPHGAHLDFSRRWLKTV